MKRERERRHIEGGDSLHKAERAWDGEREVKGAMTRNEWK